MKKSKQSVAVLLIATLLFGSIWVSGCKKNETKEIEVISADSIWYSTDKIDISSIYYSDGKSYSSVQFNYLGMVDENFCSLVQAEEMIPNDFNWETDSFYDYYQNDILTVNSDGEIVNKVALSEVIDYESEYFKEFNLIDDVINVTIVSYGSENTNRSFYEISVNPITGEISDRVPLDMNANSEASGDYDETINVGAYKISTYFISNFEANDFSYRLEVSDRAGNVNDVNLSELFPDQNILGLYVLEYGENSAMIITYDEEHSKKFFKLNFDDMTVSDTSPDGTDWIGSVNVSDITCVNGHAYYETYGCINEIDFDNQTVKKVFDFNDSNVNRFDIKDCNLVDFTEENIIFTCRTWPAGMFSDAKNEFFLYKLTKEETNPNTGKTIIEVGCIGEVTRPLADAICEYNETNPNCFIRFDNTYSVDANLNLGYDVPYEEREEAYRNLQTELSYQLSMDLIAGEGPDIIVDGYAYSQLNNEDYLLDLSGYMSELDTSKYFMNVITGTQVDDSIYQIPVSFALQGIFTSASNVSEGQVGFTFEEYSRFVTVVCNGTDPIRLPRLPYFCECISSMSDLFMLSDGMDFNNNAFKELADYTRENVPKKLYGEVDSLDFLAAYTYINGFDGYLFEYTYRNDGYSNNYLDPVLLGLPSFDGRGPSIMIQNSVGISAQTANPDECWEFIKVLLDDNVQESVARNLAFPVNRESYEKTATEMVEVCNSISSGSANYSYSAVGMVAVEVDMDAVQNLADTISISRVSLLDPSVAIILSEEIQPYYEEQKEIDEVIDILQDRVDTVFDERG